MEYGGHGGRLSLRNCGPASQEAPFVFCDFQPSRDQTMPAADFLLGVTKELTAPDGVHPHASVMPISPGTPPGQLTIWHRRR